MIATRLHSSSTSPSRWLDRRTVRPSPASRRDERAHVAHARGIEPGGRLVEQEQARVAEERGRDPEPLAHAVRVAADPVPGPVSQLDDVEHLVDAVLRAEAVVVGEQAQVLAAGEVRVEARRLDEAGDSLERLADALLDRVAAEELDRASGGADQARASCAVTSSCRRRWARGTRRRRPARRLGRLVDGDDASVALEKASGRDGRRAVHFKPFAAARAVAAGIEPAST